MQRPHVQLPHVPLPSILTDTQFLDLPVSSSEIKTQLDSKFVKDKLDGMKRLIALISTGRDASDYFADVVKNVVTPSIEVKKLVYMYLVHYAEAKTDLALLSVNSFQKELADKNQMVRGLALRTMSSIRVPIILHLIVMAVRKAVGDNSPYVRKIAANALSKIYSMDAEQKEQLVEIIANMLGDSSTMVLGSVFAAFNEVCPERLDLLHPHYRRICRVLIDMDEWSQAIVLGILTRYARTQFSDPSTARDFEVAFGRPMRQADGETGAAAAGAGAGGSSAQPAKPAKPHRQRGFYSDEEDGEGSGEENGGGGAGGGGGGGGGRRPMDADHRLLLKSTLPLLQSRNTAVVMGVSSLYMYLAPPFEAVRCAKALVRIMRTSREVGYVVLQNVASLAAERPVVRELQTYARGADRRLVAASLRAMAQCAATLPGQVARRLEETTDPAARASITWLLGAPKRPCRGGLLVPAPVAPLFLSWAWGEYCERLPRLAPDALRTLAKGFAGEDPAVKLQALTLGAKMYLIHCLGLHSPAGLPLESAAAAAAQPGAASPVPAAFAPPSASLLDLDHGLSDLGGPALAPTSAAALPPPAPASREAQGGIAGRVGGIFRHILELAKYDASYDVRDRARFLRAALFPAPGAPSPLLEHAAELLLAPKPPPTEAPPASLERARFTAGSLAHSVGQATPGYAALPAFPRHPPDPSVRGEAAAAAVAAGGKAGAAGGGGASARGASKGFYSDEEGSGSEEGSESGSETGSESGSYTESGSGSGSGSGSPRGRGRLRRRAGAARGGAARPAAAPAIDSLFESLSMGPGSSSLPAALAPTPSPPPSTGSLRPASAASAASSSPPAAAGAPQARAQPLVRPGREAPAHQLLHYTHGGGLGAEYAFQRQRSIFSASANLIRITFRNHTPNPVYNVAMRNVSSEDGVQVLPFPEILCVNPGASVEVNLHIDFALRTKPVRFELTTSTGKFQVALPPAVGELLRPLDLAPAAFSKLRGELSGLHEQRARAAGLGSLSNAAAAERLARHVNVALCNPDAAGLPAASGPLWLAGASPCGGFRALIVLELDEGGAAASLRVHCDNMVLCGLLVEAARLAVASP
eukprot:tig00021036_g17311.t1